MGSVPLLWHPPSRPSSLPTPGPACPDSGLAVLPEAEEQKRPAGNAWSLAAAAPGASQQLSARSPGLALFLESVMGSSSQA